MDMYDLKKRIIGLNEEIEEVLRKAGYPKCYMLSPENRDSDADMQMAEVISHLGYVNSVVKEWGDS